VVYILITTLHTASCFDFTKEFYVYETEHKMSIVLWGTAHINQYFWWNVFRGGGGLLSQAKQKNALFWDVTPNGVSRFGGTYRLHHHGPETMMALTNERNML
jgi:hypothetical protein